MADILDKLSRLVPFVEPYPVWVKVVIVLWIMLTGVMVASLLFGRQDHGQPDQKPVPVRTEELTASLQHQRPQEVVAEGSAESEVLISQSVEEIWRALQNRTRYEAQLLFDKLYLGKRVEYGGIVDDLAKLLDERVVIYLLPLHGKTRPVVTLIFPPDREREINHYREGNHLRVQGTISDQDPLHICLSDVTILHSGPADMEV